MTTPASLTTEIQKLAPSAIVELFVLDATALGGDILRFHAGTNKLSQNVVWQGNTFVRFPVSITGFEFNGQGQFPRPKMTVANVFSSITTILLQYEDLLGAKVIRKRTMAKFLDAENFEGGVNPTADPEAEFAEDIYYVDRKSSEDRDTVEFELASSVDLAGVRLPRRQIIQNVCIWKYRGAECGFAGPPLYGVDDQPLTSGASAEAQALAVAKAALDISKTTLDEAIATQGSTALAMNAACEYQRSGRYFNMSTTTISNVWVITGATDGVVIHLDSNNNQTTYAFRNGSPVTLGNDYRLGDVASNISPSFMRTLIGIPDGTMWLHYIEDWANGGGLCTTATSDYDDAVVARAAAQTDYDAKLATYEAAATALPEDDGQYAIDSCGKRLSSCKLRFGQNAELPFGSFPASGLIR